MHYKYAHTKFFENVPRTDFKAYSGNIVIYGAGFQGLLTAYLLGKQNIDVICFADADVRKQGTSYYGLPVISPEKMFEEYHDKLIIVTPYVLAAAYNDLKEKGLNVVTPYSLFLEFDSEEFDKLEELPAWYRPNTLTWNIDSFLRRCVNILADSFMYAAEFSVSQKCNLRCRECTSLMPYYKSPIDFELEDIIHCCELIFKHYPQLKATK